MELLIIIVGILLAPYLMLAWLYSLTKVKQLYDKEWKEHKGLLGEFERLSPEERMNLDLKRISTKPKEEIKENLDRPGWLGNPTPRQENLDRNETVYKEGLVTTPGEGKWETPADVEPKKPSQATSQPARVA